MSCLGKFCIEFFSIFVLRFFFGPQTSVFRGVEWTNVRLELNEISYGIDMFSKEFVRNVSLIKYSLKFGPVNNESKQYSICIKFSLNEI